MGRGLKIGIGVVVALVALLAINAVLVSGKTKSAEVTVSGGRLLDLPEGQVQVIERGPRDGEPIALLHCFTCAIDWWDGMLPLLAREHRVVAIDLLGHGGSEKPSAGYSMPDQAALVASAMERLGVRDAEIVGHSLGGTVAVALAEEAPDLVDRVAIIDMPSGADNGSLGFLAEITFAPVLGEALWRVKPDFAVKDGLEVAFAPGFEIPDAFVEDVKRMTFTSYDDSAAEEMDYVEEEPLGERMRRIGKPLLVIMGAEEQIVDDPRLGLQEYERAVPGVRTKLIRGAGHSPNVEKPIQTANLVLAFAKLPQSGVGSSPRDEGERGPGPQQSSSASSPNSASGVRMATDQ
jgi:pimeloyl-ACP methyl ester carboxylesterase